MPHQKADPIKHCRDMRELLTRKRFAWRPAGGPQRVPEANPLFPGVCEQPTGCAAEHPRVACAACNPGGELRGMRDDREAARSPQGPNPPTTIR